MNHSLGSIQSPMLSLRLRRQVTVLKRNDAFSENFIRLSAYTLGTVLLLFLVSMFFFWNISHEKTRFAQQQLVHDTLRQEQIRLQHQREKLLAKPRLVALAATQLDLHLPEKEQEHDLF
ncbi:MAG: hypothetical protein D3916_07735 [Candidatus Electrothrix sp. MAN1_4]|nr:hypothetical protein [Candidatus Electrothrix sp. MAN1_4]